jgi:hypothetical protein
MTVDRVAVSVEVPAEVRADPVVVAAASGVDPAATAVRAAIVLPRVRHRGLPVPVRLPVVLPPRASTGTPRRHPGAEIAVATVDPVAIGAPTAAHGVGTILIVVPSP